MTILGIGLILLCLLIIWWIINLSKEQETTPKVYPKDIEVVYQSNGKLITKTGIIRKR